MKSKFFTLDLKDLRRALIIILGTFMVSASTTLATGKLPDMEALQSIGLVAISAGLVYLGKNLLTNANDEMMKRD